MTQSDLIDPRQPLVDPSDSSYLYDPQEVKQFAKRGAPPPCGYPFHVGLLNDRQQSSLAATPWLQQAREVAPFSKLRDVQLHRPYTGIPRPGPIPVALGSLAQGCVLHTQHRSWQTPPHP